MSSVVVRDLHKTYGTVEAVRGLSFEVAPGQCFGLLGPGQDGGSGVLDRRGHGQIGVGDDLEARAPPRARRRVRRGPSWPA